MRFIKHVVRVIAVIVTFTIAIAPVTAYAQTPGSVGTWSTGTNTLPSGLQQVTVKQHNGYIYVMGGDNNSGVSQTSVYYAPINSDGSVGSWVQSSNNLPVALADASSAVYDGYLYIIGGANSGTAQSEVYSAPINANGSVGTWTQLTNGLPQALYSTAVKQTNGYVYVMGGNTGSSAVNTVYYAQLESNGQTGSWNTNSNALPQALQAGMGSINNNYLYFAGGSTAGGGTVQTSVYYAPINSDGSVGSWVQSSNSLPQARYFGSSTDYDGYMFIFGGENSSYTYQSTVYSAALSPNGSVGSWVQSSNSLPQAVVFTEVVKDLGNAYIIGGDGIGGALNTVYYASLAGYPLPGIANQTASVTSGSSVTVNVVNRVSGNPDPNSVSIVSGPSHGTAVDPAGSITYTPTAGYTGSDSLTYQVCSLDDESLCSQATLSFNVLAASPNTGYGKPTDNSQTTLILTIISITTMGAGIILRKLSKKSSTN